MLKQRVFTAIALTAALLCVLFFTPWFVFVGFVGIFFCLGAWEWANLSGLKYSFERIAYVVFISSMAVLVALFTDWATDVTRVKILLGLSCFWWGLALVFIVGYPSNSKILTKER